MFLLCARPPELSGQVRFFMEAVPAVSWTTIEPLASVDASLLGPEDYYRYYALPSFFNLGLWK